MRSLTKNPQPSTKNFFRVQSRRLADLFEPLNSSLAQSAEELGRWQGNWQLLVLGWFQSMNISYPGSQSVKRTCEGKDVFNVYMGFVSETKLPLPRISNTTDGVSAMVNQTHGFIALCKRKWSCEAFLDILKYHCIIHQQALFLHIINRKEMMDVVISAGEPELEPGALKPSIFSGAGAGAFLNISCGAGAGATKYLSAPVLSTANFNNFLS